MTKYGKQRKDLAENKTGAGADDEIGLAMHS